MKPKVFRDVYWIAFLLIEIILFFVTLPSPCLLVYFIYTQIRGIDPVSIGMFIVACLSLLIMTIVGAWVWTYKLWFPRAFGRLLVYENKVVYKCLFCKTRVLKLEECEYIGIEDYSGLNPGLPSVRGDEIAFIYISKNPYPQKYAGKITLLKNTNDFIKFSYTDALAKALIDILPAEKDNLLRSFYAKMQAADRELNANKKSKKSKKK